MVRILKIHRFILCVAVAGSAFACSPPPPPSPYVASDCPLATGVLGYPIAAHDPAGVLDTGTLSRIARSIGGHMAISRYSGDTLPEDLAAFSSALARNRPLSRKEWRPSPSDTISILVIYRAGAPAPDFRRAGLDAPQNDFTRRALRAAVEAREDALKRRPTVDTLPLEVHVTHGDSTTVLLRFGSEPGPNDGVARFAAQERDVSPLSSNRPPAYPPFLRSGGVQGEVVIAFVVRADGTPAMSTVRVLRSSHPDFTRSVLEALARNEYVPLELDCRVYPVLAQQPSVFGLR